MGWDEDKILLVEDGDEYTAYLSPDAGGEVFVGDNQVSVDTAGDSYSYGSTLDRHGAPFNFDIVFHDRYPREGEVEPVAEEIGERFREKFDEIVMDVYNVIDESDDPLHTIMNELTAEDIRERWDSP